MRCQLREERKDAAARQREFGRVDILVNNAGIARRAMALDMTDEEWDAVINVNLKGVFLCSREFGRLMIRTLQRMHRQYRVDCRFRCHATQCELLCGQRRRNTTHQGAGSRMGQMHGIRVNGIALRRSELN